MCIGHLLFDQSNCCFVAEMVRHLIDVKIIICYHLFCSLVVPQVYLNSYSLRREKRRGEENVYLILFNLGA